MLEKVIGNINPVAVEWLKRAEARQLTLTKPPGSLGRLEEIANRVAAIQETLRPSVARRRIVIFAADHGVTSEGVSPYPSEVTRQMVANFRAGGAGINALAKVAACELHVIDVGVAGELINEQVDQPHDGARYIVRRVRAGTNNIAREAAMTKDEMHRALYCEMSVISANRVAAVVCAMPGMESSNWLCCLRFG